MWHFMYAAAITIHNAYVVYMTIIVQRFRILQIWKTSVKWYCILSDYQFRNKILTAAQKKEILSAKKRKSLASVRFHLFISLTSVHLGIADVIVPPYEAKLVANRFMLSCLVIKCGPFYYYRLQCCALNHCLPNYHIEIIIYISHFVSVVAKRILRVKTCQKKSLQI